jgi:hypothetical protein
LRRIGKQAATAPRRAENLHLQETKHAWQKNGGN